MKQITIILFFLLLGACTPAPATPSENLVQTAIAQTQAAQPTALPPTDTPLPTVTFTPEPSVTNTPVPLTATPEDTGLGLVPLELIGELEEMGVIFDSHVMPDPTEALVGTSEDDLVYVGLFGTSSRLDRVFLALSTPNGASQEIVQRNAEMMVFVLRAVFPEWTDLQGWINETFARLANGEANFNDEHDGVHIDISSLTTNDGEFTIAIGVGEVKDE